MPLAVAAAAATGCGDILDFDVDQEVPEQVIAGSPLPGLLGQFFEVPLQLDIAAEIEAQQTGPIERVVLTSLVLELTATATPAGDSDDWSFVDAVDLYVESTKPGSSLPRVKIAAATSPGAVTRLELEPVPGVNLLPYVQEGAQITAEAEGRAPPDDVSYDGLAVFRVTPL